MKSIKKIILVFILIGVIGLLSVRAKFELEQKEPAPTISIICTLSLQVFTRQGTNAKYNISGDIVVDSTNSNFNGNLLPKKESPYPITLYFDEPVIHFILDTKHGRIFGKGTSDGSPKTCSGKAAGTQSGPTWDDQGNWLGQWKRTPKPIPPLPYSITVIKWALIGMLTTFGLGWLIGKRSTKDE